MQAYHLYFIRHGSTSAVEKKIYVGQTDIPLSEKGVAELCVKVEECEYPRVAKVYSSPLHRCLGTAEILYPDVTLQKIPEFMEMNFGIFEGMSLDDLMGREDYMEWIRGGRDKKPPEGESMEELCARLYKGMHKVILDMMKSDIYHAAVITHSGIITTLLSCFGLPKLDPNDLLCGVGQGFEVIIHPQLWQNGQTFEIHSRII